MTLFIRNPKDATRKLLECINESGKDAGDKINTQKSAEFLTLTINHQKEKLRKQFHLPLHQKECSTQESSTQEGKRPVLRKLKDTDVRS